MSAWDWVIVAGAGVAGYLIVSWLINRAHRNEPPAPPADEAAAPPPAQPFTSAWDEFNRK